MSRRSRFDSARRRRMLSFQVADRLDQQLEGRSTVTPIGAAALAIGAGTAIGQAASEHAGGGNDGVMDSASIGAGRSPAGQGRVAADEDFIPGFGHPAPAGGGGPAVEGAVAALVRSAAGDDGDWLTLSPASDPAPSGSGISTPWQPAKSAGGGAAMAPRGGSGSGMATPTVRGQVTPFRVPAPQQAASGAGASSAGSSAALLAALGGSAQQGGAAAAALAFAPHTPSSGSPATGPVDSPAASPLAGGAPIMASGGGSHSGGVSALSPTGGGSALLSFPYFTVEVLDTTDGVTLYPGVDQVGHAGTTIVLDAQVTGSTVSSYNWDTTNLGAFSSSGATTYQLTFQWSSTVPSNMLHSVTLSVTDTNSHVETFTYDFLLLSGTSSSSGGGGSGGSGGGSGGGGGGTVTWPSSYSPDTISLNAPEWQSDGVSVNAISGALDASIPLPAYNPNVPALALTYDSQAADPQPIVVAEHPLSASGSVPSQVSAALTFNSSTGSTYYYDTSTFNPGDIQQIALQANTSPSTGRYSYSMQVVDHGTSLTTTTYSGTADVLNESSGALGTGWSVAGLEQITSESGGVMLNLGEGGATLWFATSGGGYTSPAGDFSTLTQLPSGGGWTRTLTDGTKDTFNSSGYETASIDRNGLHTTFAYDGSNRLSTVKDPYSGFTTFTYSGGVLSTIEDPALRLTTFTYSGGNLQSVKQADGSVTTYTYGSSGQLAEVKDPLGNVVSVVYDSAGRVGTITSPDSATEEFAPFQEQGWTDSGTSGSPAAAMLFAVAAGSYTNPNGNTTSVQPDWYGLGTVGVGIDALGDVQTNDVNANGLVLDAIDPLNRMDQYAYDSHGNVTSHTFADFTYESYDTYNSFAEPASFTDAALHTTSYTYDGNGNLTVIKDPLSNLTTMTYTGNGRVQTVKDANNHTTSYQYDSQDRLTTVTNADSTTVLYGYNSQGDVTSTTDELSKTTTYSYDALDRETGMTDPLGNQTTYVYDSGGNLTADEKPTPSGQTARTTTYAYDSMNRMTTQTDPLGYQTIVGYDADGNVTTVTDPLSRITTIAYDALDRPTVVTDPMSGVTTTTYDADGEKLTVTDPLGRVTTTTYNARGWVDTQTNPLGFTTTYSYNNVGQVTDIDAPTTSGGGSSGGNWDQTHYDYNSDGRLVDTIDPTSAETYYYYDSVGNKTAVKDPNGNTTSYAYDSMNRLTTITDPLSHTTVYGYDADGRPITVTDGLNHTTTTAYDADGRATTLTSAVNGVTTITYDAAGREVSLTDPVGNTTTWTNDADDRVTKATEPNGATVTYVYDNDGELTDTTDQDGRRTTYSYNADGDQTGEKWLSGGTTLNLITYSYDKDNELTGAADSYATLTFTYDSGGGRLSAVTSGPGTGQPHVTLTYTNDPSENVATISDSLSSAGIITYTRDPDERVTGIAASYGGTAGPQVAISYDSGGRITAESRTIGGSGLAVNTSFSYDAASRQTTITDQSVSGGTTTMLATYVYSYDNANRVTTQVNADGTYTYTYDNADELTGVDKGGTSVESYSYDLNGSRTGTGYATTVMNELSTAPGNTYTYDQAGNLISDNNGTTITTYTYDYRNRLTEVTQGGTVIATYTYDALGDRIGIDDNGTQTWTVYDGKNPYADFNGAGTPTERYVHGPGVVNGAAVDELLARTSSGGTTAWYLTDKLGSVRDVVNSSGTVLDYVVYDSFGNIVSESSASNGDRFKYAGMEYDSVTGQYYDRARYYSPLIGRFEIQDPKSFGAGDTNLYRYVGNDPANATDPSGMDSGGGSIGQYTGTGVGTIVGAGTAWVGITFLVTGPPGWLVGGTVVLGAVFGGVLSYYGSAGTGDSICAGAISGIYNGVIGGGVAALGAAGVWWMWSAASGVVSRLLNGPSCFAAGTQVLMATEIGEGEHQPSGEHAATWTENRDETHLEGANDPGVAVLCVASRRTKSIEDVTIGELVAAKDVRSGALRAGRVVRTYHNVSYYKVFIHIIGSDGSIQTLTTTDGHPFWVEGQGWTQAKDLLVGCQLMQSDGTMAHVRSTQREFCAHGVHMYNIEVDGEHTYFVSQDCAHESILVHNGDCGEAETLWQQQQYRTTMLVNQAQSRVAEAATRIADARANLQQEERYYAQIKNDAGLSEATRRYLLKVSDGIIAQWLTELETWKAYLPAYTKSLGGGQGSDW